MFETGVNPRVTDPSPTYFPVKVVLHYTPYSLHQVHGPLTPFPRDILSGRLGSDLLLLWSLRVDL